MAKLGRLLRKATSSPSEPYCPDCGDIIEIDFDPQVGREHMGKRPALVLSPRSYNELARLCVLCPMTNQAKGYPFEVAVPSSDPLGGGVVLTDQVKSLSWQKRGARFKARATTKIMAEVLAKIKALLQIS